MSETVTMVCSPSGTTHILRAPGVATLCGLDVSTPRRELWPTWEDYSAQGAPFLCVRCKAWHREPERLSLAGPV